VEAFSKWSSQETEMNSKLEATKVKVHAAFCDNIDTRTVLETLKELVGSANAYVEANRATPGGINRQLLRGTALYITRIFDVLGLVARGEEPVGFPAAGGGNGSADLETQVLPYLTALADFRDSVRKSAIEAKAVPILQECDRLRDDVLPNLGVRKDTLKYLFAFGCLRYNRVLLPVHCTYPGSSVCYHTVLFLVTVLAAHRTKNSLNCSVVEP
jgi:cysteinyl-tRNA synthetase